MKLSSLSILLLSCSILSGSAFTTFHPSSSTSTRLFSSAASNGFPEGFINIKKIDPSTYGTEDDQVMQVASYRNQLTSPEQMIAKQQAKRDSFDPTQSAIQGVKIGLGIGAAAGIITALNGGGEDIQQQVLTGVKNFATIGGLTAALLGYNNYSGNRVYVMDMDEARNRLTVDFVASLKISQDIGFAAYVENLGFKNGKFEGCNGIVGCVDCQLRNSKYNVQLENGVMPKPYPEVPFAHIHIKNMDVDESVRRKGIAKQLMASIEEWARSETDAEMLTLEVRDDNAAAVRLYEGCGFVKDTTTKRKTRGGCSFMVKKLN